MTDYSACPCAICIYREKGVSLEPCKTCCAHSPPKGSIKEDYPAFVEDFRIKTLKTEDYGLGIPEFKLVD